MKKSDRCWKILGIPKNSNSLAIKEAYRNLVKKYHPDLAQTPEKIRKYTIICAEINIAYKEALNNISQNENLVESLNFNSLENKNEKYATFFLVLAGIVGVIFFVLIWYGFSKGIDLISSLDGTNPIKIFITAIITFAISVMVGGFILSFSINFFLLYVLKTLFLDWLISKLEIPKYEDKILWIILVLVNTYLFWGTELGNLGLKSKLDFSYYYNLIWKITAAYSLPLFFLIDWIFSFVKYNTIKNKADIQILY